MFSLAAKGALPCVAQKAKATRASRRPAPFTPARTVFARAAAPEAVAEEEEQLWDVELEQILNEVVADAVDDDIDLEDDEIALIEEAEALVEELEEVPTALAAAATAEAEAEEDDDEDDKAERAEAGVVAEALYLDNLLNGEVDDLTEGELEDLEAVAADAEEVEVTDVVVSSRGDRYIEAPLTPVERAAIAPLKLTRAELRNLVPKDWDQINIDFFSSKKEENIPLPEFRLNVLWTSQNVAVAVDQVYSRGQVSPLTEYFFWPRNDAWEEMKSALEARPWINERDKIILLNRLTQIINFWQDEAVKHTVDEARVEFPDCNFMA